MATFEQIIPFLGPSIAALLVATVINLATETISGKGRIFSQATIFGFLIVISSIYLSQNVDDVTAVWTAFSQLKGEQRFAFSIFIIGFTYFGTFAFTSTPTSPSRGHTGAASLETPASCDSIVSFTIPTHLPDSDLVVFKDAFDRILNEIINDLSTAYEMPAENIDWVRRMINYTVSGGKMNRGLALMSVQTEFAKAKGITLSNKERTQSAALGWCIEFLQAFFLVADDVMDDSVTRRGQPCWFRLPEVKLISINDSFILESCVYKILKRYFGSEVYYPQLIDLFIEVTRQTEIGQLFDLTSQPLQGPIDLSRFTIARYTSIVRYKTAFYSFYLPVALGMIVSGIKDRKHYDKAREILLIMGEYFQVQDDFLDCYGEPEVIGKVGTDIQDNKCSWLVVQALNRVDGKQRKLLQDNYGQHDEKKVQKVKALYSELNLIATFEAYEEESYGKIQTLLGEVKDIPKEVFEFLLRKIYKRSK